jgi:glycosyltransferase involved in cell wall biosynthesis
MRIAYVTQWFDPEPNIVKGIAFVRALEAAGHQLTVVTGLPNYPDGKIYPGYRLRLIQHETLGGVKVVRLPLYPSHDRSSLRRSMNFLSFFISAFLYLLFRRSRFDLAYVYHPPITVGLAAACAGVPFVLDVQDLWPDTIAATGMSRASKLVRPLGWCCSFVYRRSLAIVTQSEGIRSALMDRGVPAGKITVIRNWADANLPDVAKMAETGNTFTVVYGGNLGRAQQLEHLLEAAAILIAERPEIRIKLYGSGVEGASLREAAKARGLKNVHFAGRVPQSEAVHAFAEADALLLHLGDDPLFSITIPSKTQFYLAMGRPIIAAVNGEAGQMLRSSGASIVIPPADPRALATAIGEMADIPRERREAMGRSGAEYYRRNMSFSQGLHRTLGVLNGTYDAMRAGQGSR